MAAGLFSFISSHTVINLEIGFTDVSPMYLRFIVLISGMLA